jgi:hypothetical protein
MPRDQCDGALQSYSRLFRQDLNSYNICPRRYGLSRFVPLVMFLILTKYALSALLQQKSRCFWNSNNSNVELKKKVPCGIINYDSTGEMVPFDPRHQGCEEWKRYALTDFGMWLCHR